MTRTLYIQMVSRQVILKADLRLHCVRNLLNDKH
jgi:hypothetical protein